ncbi:MAG: PHP domain-containing protein [Acutalibacteraceae bacterium]
MKSDLHLHTTASDGTKSPSAIVEWAAERGLELIAVTDHDTVSGVEEAREKADALGVRFVAGIEISAYSNSEIHILGYNVDYRNKDFLKQVEGIKDMRRARNLLIGEKLAALGITPDVDFGADGVGRMNIARQLLKEGYVGDIQEAFDRYLGPKGRAYASTRRTSPLEAVKLISSFGGIAVLAHPKKYLQDRTLDMLITGLKPFGLKGIETFYPKHTAEDVAALTKTAEKYKLTVTGGSDYHGEEDKRFVCELPDSTLRALGVLPKIADRPHKPNGNRSGRRPPQK